MLMQRDRGGGDVGDGVNVGVVVVEFVLINRGAGGEEIDLRLNDMADAVEIEEVGIDRIVNAPKAGGHANPAPPYNRVWSSPPGLEE